MPSRHLPGVTPGSESVVCDPDSVAVIKSGAASLPVARLDGVLARGLRLGGEDHWDQTR